MTRTTTTADRAAVRMRKMGLTVPNRRGASNWQIIGHDQAAIYMVQIYGEQAETICFSIAGKLNKAGRAKLKETDGAEPCQPFSQVKRSSGWMDYIGPTDFWISHEAYDFESNEQPLEPGNDSNNCECEKCLALRIANRPDSSYEESDDVDCPDEKWLTERQQLDEGFAFFRSFKHAWADHKLLATCITDRSLADDLAMPMGVLFQLPPGLIGSLLSKDIILAYTALTREQS